MKIYLIENHADYEGFNIVKVFKSKVKALEFMVTIAESLGTEVITESWGFKVYPRDWDARFTSIKRNNAITTRTPNDRPS